QRRAEPDPGLLPDCRRSLPLPPAAAGCEAHHPRAEGFAHPPAFPIRRRYRPAPGNAGMGMTTHHQPLRAACHRPQPASHHTAASRPLIIAITMASRTAMAAVASPWAPGVDFT